MRNLLAKYFFICFSKENSERIIMQISNNPVRPTFGIRICNSNNALTEIVECAAGRNQLPLLDGILNNLYHVKGGDLLITHGVRNGSVYSNFTIGKNTVSNFIEGYTNPAEVSLKGLFDLLDKNNPKLMQLLGAKVSRFVSKDSIIYRYSAK
jgi:hypothetical protein